VLAVLAVAAVVALRLEGRSWWCACGRAVPVTMDAWSSHTSQHALDPYSLTHVSHGFLFFCAALLWLRSAPGTWSFVAAVGVEIAWEVFENSTFVIDRYRTATAALGYTGDSVANSLGDIACCALGFALAARIGWRATLVTFAAIEILLLAWIRDSLLLDVTMLLYPIEAVKQWQLGG